MSSQAPQVTLGASAEADVRIDWPGWEPMQLQLTWTWRLSTWTLENLTSSPVLVDNKRLEQGQRRPLLGSDVVIEVAGTVFYFQRKPDKPCYSAQPLNDAGRPCTFIPLGTEGLVLGRGPKNKDNSNRPRISMDSEVMSISSMQAEIVRSGSDYVLVNLNPSSSGRTMLNGSQEFEQAKLVLGDCIRIPNYEYYTFKFTGDGLRHLGEGGAIQGRDLTVVVDSGATILHHVSIEVLKGEFVGIIGGSGQGKSTLMNAVCGIFPATSGTVTVDGRLIRSPREVAQAGIGYVPQDDIVHKDLSVEDALWFAARLRMRAPKNQIADVVDATLNTLKLTEHRKKRIAVLSGGQRKRVSIGSELITSPDYLFLDEPTSGLDPLTEKELMGELAKLAKRNMMGVVCTTHVLQTSFVFSKLGLVSRGRLIFCGRPEDSVKFFLFSGGIESSQPALPGASSDSADISMAPDQTADEIDSEMTAQNQGEAYLLSKIDKIYERSQDTAKPKDVQDRDADAWEKKFRESRFWKKMTDMGAPQPVAPGGKVGTTTTLWLLILRQWKLLVSSRLNYLFLAAQAIVIGGLVGWVSDDRVFQMFLSIIATMWFGCSNGAQQIVAEMAIFRRERLSGLGLNSYIMSKFLFLTTITCVQAFTLFFVVLVSSHLLHKPELIDEGEVKADWRGKVPDRETRVFREAFFEKDWNALAKGDSSHAEAAAGAPLGVKAESEPAATHDFLVVDAGGSFAPSEVTSAKLAHYSNPTGLSITESGYQALETMAWFFRVRENVLDSLKVRKTEYDPKDSTALLYVPKDGSISWMIFLGNLILLRFGALFGASLVGVALGLAVSALVKTPTQSVMWVPLILIPQILFGAFVVTVPEMEKGVFWFSQVLPSYNLQRIMDVALLYGREAPRMTNETKIPGFLNPPPHDEEEVKWGIDKRNITKYDKISDVNKSWQNLVVLRSTIGARFKELAANGKDTVNSVEQRDDVYLSKGMRYLSFQPAIVCALVLIGWVFVSYIVTLVALIKKQTGR